LQLEKLICAKCATFDAFDEDAAVCHPETRKEVLEKTEQWGGDQDGECIFWLSGMAGTGKSTIARTVTGWFTEKGERVASFFFKTGQKLRGDAQALFTTLAFQLASVMPDLKPSICRAIKKDPDISQKDPGRQWEDLIFKPRQEFKCGLFKSPVLILVIDALDECRPQRNKDSYISTLLDLFYRVKNIRNIRIRVFITSRPELEIIKKFSKIHHHNLMLDQPEDLANTRRDIPIFLEAKLREVAENQEPPFTNNWPDDVTMQKLLEKVRHLLIYAVTIYRFLRRSYDPDGEVLQMLSRTSESDLSTKKMRCTKLLPKR
jgi:NACHT domain